MSEEKNSKKRPRSAKVGGAICLVWGGLLWLGALNFTIYAIGPLFLDTITLIGAILLLKAPIPSRKFEIGGVLPILVALFWFYTDITTGGYGVGFLFGLPLAIGGFIGISAVSTSKQRKLPPPPPPPPLPPSSDINP